MSTILCDVDSVVAVLLQPWLDIYNREYGRAVCVNDIHDWNMAKCVPDGAAIFPIIDRPGFFRDLDVMPGAEDGLRTLLARGHDVFLVSAGSGAALGDKSSWVRSRLPFMRDRLFFTDGKTPKGLLRGDVMIDDGPHNLIAFKERNPSARAIAASYRYTSPAHSICDFIAPFADDPASGWQSILDYLAEAA